jgi:hypothetical protein
MRLYHPQYIIDDSGKKLSVVLPFNEYEQMIAEIESKHSIPEHDKSAIKPSSLRGKMSRMTNEQIDQQFNGIDPTKPKKKLSELAGKLSHETAEALQKHVKKSRREWEERLNKQF